MKENDRILFFPDKNSDILFSTSSYGLPTFHYLSLAMRTSGSGFARKPVTEDAGADAKKTENPPKSQPLIYTIPLTRMFIRFLGLAAVAVILFLLMSIPVKEVDRASYSASFVPQEIIPKKTVDEILSDAFSAMEVSGDADEYVAEGIHTNTPGSISRTAAESPDMKSESPVSGGAVVKTPETKPEADAGAKALNVTVAELPAASSAESSTEKQAASTSPVKTVSKNVSGKYYVIIGSFDTYRRAKTYLNGLKGKIAVTAGILESDGRIRVYAQRFPVRKSAQSCLNKIRQNAKHKQAWLYEKP
jgi:hypothetical protein